MLLSFSAGWEINSCAVGKSERIVDQQVSLASPKCKIFWHSPAAAVAWSAGDLNSTFEFPFMRGDMTAHRSIFVSSLNSSFTCLLLLNTHPITNLKYKRVRDREEECIQPE